MDLGIISVRYARALLKYSDETGTADEVYKEMMTLAESYIAVPELRHTMDNPMIPASQKAELLKAAAGGEVSDLTERLINLVLHEGRENVMQFIANSYVTLYRQQRNIIRGKLTTAVPVTPDVEGKMKQMVTSRTNGVVEFTTAVDPEILGGFVLEYDTYRMDSSVKSQLDKILKQLN